MYIATLTRIKLFDVSSNYHLYDYQHNVRLVLNENKHIEEQNNYYPFGMPHADHLASAQLRKTTGKEWDIQNGLYLLDYGARLYDPVLGSFTTQDPLAEKYYHLSPYAYCTNNPINYIDPDGREIWIDDGVHEIFLYTIGMDSNDNLFVKRLNEMTTTEAGMIVVNSLVSSKSRYTYTNKPTGVEGTGASYLPEKRELRLKDSNTLGFAEDTFHAYQHLIGEPLKTDVTEVDAHIFSAKMNYDIEGWDYVGAASYLNGDGKYQDAVNKYFKSKTFDRDSYKAIVENFFLSPVGEKYLEFGYKRGIIKETPLVEKLRLFPIY